MALRHILPAFFLFLLGACSLPTNVALKNVDSLRTAQESCLRTNVARLNTVSADPEKIAHDAAASCHDSTERLAAYAVPHVSLQERHAFEEDALNHARAYVMQSRSVAALR
ncbi:MAG TPA: hypothetical protein VFB13_02185 [Reyranella sp.]|nr:hypothetical protein [Reyranella sp.]